MDEQKIRATIPAFCEKPPAVEYIRITLPQQGVIEKLKSLLVNDQWLKPLACRIALGGSLQAESGALHRLKEWASAHHWSLVL